MAARTAPTPKEYGCPVWNSTVCGEEDTARLISVASNSTKGIELLVRRVWSGVDDNPRMGHTFSKLRLFLDPSDLTVKGVY